MNHEFNQGFFRAFINMNSVGSMRSKIAKAMLNRIKKHSDFKSTEDPIALLRKQSYGKQL